MYFLKMCYKISVIALADFKLILDLLLCQRQDGLVLLCLSVLNKQVRSLRDLLSVGKTHLQLLTKTRLRIMLVFKTAGRIQVIGSECVVNSQATGKVTDPDDLQQSPECPNEASDAETLVVNSDSEQLSNQVPAGDIESISIPDLECAADHAPQTDNHENFGHGDAAPTTMPCNLNGSKTSDPVVQFQSEPTAGMAFVPDAPAQNDNRDTLEHGHTTLSTIHSDLNDETTATGVELQSENIIHPVCARTALHQSDLALPMTQGHALPSTSYADLNNSKTTGSSKEGHIGCGGSGTRPGNGLKTSPYPN